MKMKLTLLLPLLFLFACEKDEPESTTPPLPFATLEVTVSKCDVQADPFCQTSLTPMPGAEVYLFEEKQFRDEGTHIAYQGTTDAAGKITFPVLEKPEYWLTIIASDGRSQAEYTKTPLRAKTFLPVIFEKQ